MTDITRARTVAAEPEVVWGILAEFASISEWADNVDHSCMLERAETLLGSTRRIQTGRNTVVERVVEFNPPAALAYDIEGLPERLQTVRNRWTLTSEADGATAVALTTTIVIGPRPPQQLAERIACRVFATQSDTMLAGLAAHLELHHV